jgi:hypothetical protein
MTAGAGNAWTARCWRSNFLEADLSIAASSPVRFRAAAADR